MILGNEILLRIAFNEYGVNEITGREDNPRVIEYFNSLGYDGDRLKDETAWCAAFLNYCAKVAGLEYTGKLNARSFLKVGEIIQKPVLGDIAILWRESPQSWKGHVGIFINENQSGTHYNLLGGNQSNRVQVSAYHKSRLLGFRRLRFINEDLEKL